MQQTRSPERQKVAYERFLQLPVAVVLAALWLAGMALLSLFVLMPYTLVMLLA